MTDPLPIQPFTKPVSGAVTLPGSKSITNRALLLAALCDAPVTLTGALFSEDTEIMCDALGRLGFSVESDSAEKSIRVAGQGGTIPNAEADLFIGNAGTAARFLTAMLCLKEGGTYRLDGTEAMRKRPMKGLLDALVSHGATEVTYQGEPGHFPFTLKTKGIPGGTLEVDASASSQILSALLMVAPLALSPLTVKLRGDTVSHPFVEMTMQMMKQFGITMPYKEDSSYIFEGNSKHYHLTYDNGIYPVEPDATAASYYLTLPYITGGNLILKNGVLNRLQGDRAYIFVLKKLGADINHVDASDLQISFPDEKQIQLDEDFNAISDTFLTLAAITPILWGQQIIRGIEHTRKQETDRVNAMAVELRKLGQGVKEAQDSLTIQPDIARMKMLSASKPVEIDTYHDHRVAMSFGILGCYDLHGDGRPWISIRNPKCCAKTFPNFFEVLESLRKQL